MIRVISAIMRIVQALIPFNARDMFTFFGGAALFAGLWMYEPWVALVAIGAPTMALGLSKRLRRWLD